MIGMYKDSLFSIILAVSFVCGSCMSENDKGAQLFIQRNWFKNSYC